MRALGKDQFFALLRRVSLDDANPAQRFAEPSSDFGVDLAAFAEERAQTLERCGQAAAECNKDDDRDRRELPIEIKQNAERHDGGQRRSRQLHETGPDQVPDAFRVGHDPRDQDAGLGRVEVTDRQTHDVRFDLFTHVCDRPLRRDAEDLRVGKRCHHIHQSRRPHRHRQFRQ